MVERYSTNIQGGMTMKLEFTGTYARDDQGSTYIRRKLTRSKGPLPVIGPTDTAIVLDRPSRLAFFNDLTAKTVRKDNASSSNWQVGPQSRKQFDRSHAGEKSLGKQTISGIECEGYEAPEPRYKKHFNETWYALPLNFVVVKRTGYTLQKEPVETLLEGIQVGPPDPSLFRPPQGFREVFQ